MICDLERLVRTRDGAILLLWEAFRDLSDELPAEEWTDADLELWGKVTEHEAVQSRLDSANVPDNQHKVSGSSTG